MFQGKKLYITPALLFVAFALLISQWLIVIKAQSDNFSVDSCCFKSNNENITFSNNIITVMCDMTVTELMNNIEFTKTGLNYSVLNELGNSMALGKETAAGKIIKVFSPEYTTEYYYVREYKDNQMTGDGYSISAGDGCESFVPKYKENFVVGERINFPLLLRDKNNWESSYKTDTNLYTGMEFGNNGVTLNTNAVQILSVNSFSNEILPLNVNTNGDVCTVVIGLRTQPQAIGSYGADYGYYFSIDINDKIIRLYKKSDNYNNSGFSKFVTEAYIGYADNELLKTGVDIECFAIEKNGGISLSMSVNGTEYFSFFDDGISFGVPITQDGCIYIQAVNYFEPHTVNTFISGKKSDDGYIDLCDLLRNNKMNYSSALDPVFKDILLPDGRNGISVGGYIQEPTWGMSSWSDRSFTTAKSLKFLAKASENDGFIWVGIGCKDFNSTIGGYDPWSKLGYYAVISQSYIQIRKNEAGNDWETGTLTYWFSEHYDSDATVPHIYELGTRIENNQTYLFLIMDEKKILEMPVDGINGLGSVYFSKRSSKDIFAAVPAYKLKPSAPVTKDKYIDLYNVMTDSELTSSNFTRPNIIDVFNKEYYAKKLYYGTQQIAAWGTKLWSDENYESDKILRFKASTYNGNVSVGIAVKGLTHESESFTGQWNAAGYYLYISPETIRINPNPNGNVDEYNKNAVSYSLSGSEIDMSLEHEYQFGMYSKNNNTFLYVMLDGVKLIETVTTPIFGNGAVYLEKSTYATITTVNADKKWLPYEVSFGDVNDDENINIKDLVRLKKYLCGLDVQINVDAADITLDDDIAANDIIYLRKILLNIF